MKNITLSADERLIEAAREKARNEQTTLNQKFREWLIDYARNDEQVADAMELIHHLQRHVSTGGRRFTRDEMNER
ncbi:MAG: hypothetical protein WBO97_11795 [Tepidiformaceae bacterium]